VNFRDPSCRWSPRKTLKANSTATAVMDKPKAKEQQSSYKGTVRHTTMMTFLCQPPCRQLVFTAHRTPIDQGDTQQQLGCLALVGHRNHGLVSSMLVVPLSASEHEVNKAGGPDKLHVTCSGPASLLLDYFPGLYILSQNPSSPVMGTT